jgi:hypothetical protein
MEMGQLMWQIRRKLFYFHIEGKVLNRMQEKQTNGGSFVMWDKVRQKEYKKQYDQQPQNNKKKRARDKRYRANNEERLTEYRKQYRATNKKRIAERDKQYYHEHREKIFLNNRNNTMKNTKNEFAAYKRQWYQANKEKRKTIISGGNLRKQG